MLFLSGMFAYTYRFLESEVIVRDLRSCTIKRIFFVINIHYFFKQELTNSRSQKFQVFQSTLFQILRSIVYIGCTAVYLW